MSVRHNRRYGKGAVRRADNRNAGTGASLHVEGRTVLLSTVGHDAGYTGSDPTRLLQKQILDALDPSKVPSKPKRFSEMTDEEKAEMRRLYEGKSMRGGGR